MSGYGRLGVRGAVGAGVSEAVADAISMHFGDDASDEEELTYLEHGPDPSDVALGIELDDLELDEEINAVVEDMDLGVGMFADEGMSFGDDEDEDDTPEPAPPRVAHAAPGGRIGQANQLRPMVQAQNPRYGAFKNIGALLGAGMQGFASSVDPNAMARELGLGAAEGAGVQQPPPGTPPAWQPRPPPPPPAPPLPPMAPMAPPVSMAPPMAPGAPAMAQHPVAAAPQMPSASGRSLQQTAHQWGQKLAQQLVPSAAHPAAAPAAPAAPVPAEASAATLPPTYVADDATVADAIQREAISGVEPGLQLEESFGASADAGLVGSQSRLRAKHAAARAAAYGGLKLAGTAASHSQSFVEDTGAQPVLYGNGQIFDAVYGEMVAVPCPSCAPVAADAVHMGATAHCAVCDGYGAILVPDTDLSHYVASPHYGWANVVMPLVQLGGQIGASVVPGLIRKGKFSPAQVDERKLKVQARLRRKLEKKARKKAAKAAKKAAKAAPAPVAAAPQAPTPQSAPQAQPAPTVVPPAAAAVAEAMGELEDDDMFGLDDFDEFGDDDFGGEFGDDDFDHFGDMVADDLFAGLDDDEDDDEFGLFDDDDDDDEFGDDDVHDEGSSLRYGLARILVPASHWTDGPTMGA